MHEQKQTVFAPAVILGIHEDQPGYVWRWFCHDAIDEERGCGKEKMAQR